MKYIYQVKFYEDWDKGRELINELFFTSYDSAIDYLSSLKYHLKDGSDVMGKWHCVKSYGEFAWIYRHPIES